ncbi:hypothetical protein RJ640_021158 [Escallonia rubra]|uniref:Uncharacterized protein n=1 Tax=Escallonia rubra TaxID=112253 RepID=A0AA88UDS4_9ASTE|nr:hypothetical protein RJ640_021158 [Escallonia rubra]
MSENVSVIAQTHDLQMIVHEIISKGIQVDEQMQVAAIIDRLPNLWREFQKGLRHKQSELSIVNLMVRLQIEEEARKQDKKNKALANNTHANHAKTTKVTVKPMVMVLSSSTSFRSSGIYFSTRDTVAGMLNLFCKLTTRSKWGHAVIHLIIHSIELPSGSSYALEDAVDIRSISNNV